MVAINDAADVAIVVAAYREFFFYWRVWGSRRISRALLGGAVSTAGDVLKFTRLYYAYPISFFFASC